ncbi:MAG: hypothetical protein ACOYL3_06375 [Desulfuromonadaceae bacterium]
MEPLVWYGLETKWVSGGSLDVYPVLLKRLSVLTDMTQRNGTEWQHYKTWVLCAELLCNGV